jgi:glycosyltransferase involved in cell wall biosynthesis
MKIAFLHHSFKVGHGTDSLIYQYSKRLASKGHEVKVFCFKSDYSSQAFDIVIIPIGSSIVATSVISPALLYLNFHSFLESKAHYIREELEKFDIVITMMYPATYICSYPTRLKTKWVHIEWSTPNIGWDTLSRKAYYSLFKWGNGLGCKKADKVLVASKFIKEWVKNTYNSKSQALYLDGIDFDLFDKTKYQTWKSKEALYVGRISPHKNIELLLRAFFKIHLDYHLTLVGSMPDERYLKSLKNLLDSLDSNWTDKVSFTGSVPWADLPKYYADCDFVVNPSLWEGFMRCESFAFEKPMIVLDNTSNRETVESNETGLVVPNTSSGALAWSMSHLMSSKITRETLGQKGYKWAKTNLDLDIIVTHLEEELNEL